MRKKRLLWRINDWTQRAAEIHHRKRKTPSESDSLYLADDCGKTHCIEEW